MPKVVKVPACPKCNSKETGIILYDIMLPGTFMKTIIRSAKRGYHVKMYSPLEYDEEVRFDNFCNVCRYEWKQKDPYEKERLSIDRYIPYLEERNLNSIKGAIRKRTVLDRLFERIYEKIKRNGD